MMTTEAAYHQLCAYTLGLGDPAFIHQHVVDAHAAQNATGTTKPIALTFSLVGLYLHLEKQFSGKPVQRTHMYLAKRKRPWPSFPLPRERGTMTAVEVMAQPAGAARARVIDAWCASVWSAYHESRGIVVELLRECDID